MSFIVSIAKITQPDFKSRAQSTNTLQFLTIGHSHYGDFARWALQLKGIDFKEYSYAPVQHILPAVALRFLGGVKHLHISSFLRKNLEPEPSTPEKKLERDSEERATSLPVAVTADGRFLLDSWEIAELSGLEAPDPAFKKLLDEELGPLTRQLSYYYMLKPSNYNVWEGMCTEGSHWIWKLLWYLGLSKVATTMMQAVFKPSDTEEIKVCREKLLGVFEKIERNVIRAKGVVIKAGKTGSKFIHGDTFGISDIALASIAGLFFLPTEYCSGRYLKWFRLLEAQDRELQVELARYRGTALGKFCMDFYREFRAYRIPATTSV